MNAILKERLESLRNEYNMGQQKLKELEQQSVSLKETMLRISGAIQVLEEMLNNSNEEY